MCEWIYGWVGRFVGTWEGERKDGWVGKWICDCVDRCINRRSGESNEITNIKEGNLWKAKRNFSLHVYQHELGVSVIMVAVSLNCMQAHYSISMI
jgi:hypothetical protein